MGGPALPKEIPPLATEALVELRRVVGAEVVRAVRTLAHLHRRGVLTNAQYRRLLSQVATECHLIVAHATWEPELRGRPAPALRLPPLRARDDGRVPVLSGRD
ncbi:MAG TPA: hypothetical protein VHK06_06810 [Candidatus Limnocylindria bacterium]|nr:hypothetical protein [Candidatus Limnocylindria bacterium]